MQKMTFVIGHSKVVNINSYFFSFLLQIIYYDNLKENTKINGFLIEDAHHCDYLMYDCM